MKNFVFIFCIGICGVSYAVSCDTNSTWYDACRCLISNQRKVVKDSKSKLPGGVVALAEKAGYFVDKEWDNKDMEEFIMSWLTEFMKLSTNDKVEIFREYLTTKWDELMGDDMKETYESNKQCFDCCGMKTSSVRDELTLIFGLFMQ